MSTFTRVFFLRRLLTPMDTQVESSIFRLRIGRVSLESPRRSVIAAITVRSDRFVLESLVSIVLCVDESDRQESGKQEDDHRASPDDFNLKKDEKNPSSVYSYHLFPSWVRYLGRFQVLLVLEVFSSLLSQL